MRKTKTFPWHCLMEKPRVSKGCPLAVWRFLVYLRASKKHGTFVTPGNCFLFLHASGDDVGLDGLAEA